MLQAARKRLGPISPCSNGLMKRPSGLRANSRSRLVLRTERGCADHRHLRRRCRRRRTAPRHHKRNEVRHACSAKAQTDGSTMSSQWEWRRPRSPNRRQQRGAIISPALIPALWTWIFAMWRPGREVHGFPRGVSGNLPQRSVIVGVGPPRSAALVQRVLEPRLFDVAEAAFASQ